jgi:light-regulated signal transduction histidine kinase (bacteriophytochrome)
LAAPLAEFIRRKDLEVISTRAAVEIGELEFERPDGRRVWLRVTKVPVPGADGQPRFILGIAEEITARRHAELEIRRLNAELERRVAERTAQLAAANKELESFCYSASHDLRAPLRAVEGFGAALSEDFKDALPAEGQGYIERMRSAAQHMGKLIDDLLSLSRMSRAELKRSPVNLTEVVNEIIPRLKAGAPSRQAEFLVPPELTVSADPTLIRAVMQNLLENAWKFTSKQPATRIEIGTMALNGETAYFVKDNGVGFNMKYVHKLFVAFQRLHSPSEYPGSGIGLASVQRIIARHGGQVGAESAPSAGAIFHFTLGTPSAVTT